MIFQLPVLSARSPVDAAPTGFSDSPDWHRFDVDGVPSLLVVDRSRIYSLSAEIADAFDRDGVDQEVLDGLDIGSPSEITDLPPTSMPLRALSLAIAQKCNLGCSYCYAEGGSFGGDSRHMSAAVAQLAVDRLLSSASAGDRVNLSFLGGEPLSNRDVLYEVTRYAVQRATDRGVILGLSITTNGTLLTEEDGAFFEHHGFAVTVSLDGVGSTHDQLRPFKGGRGSYEQIIARVRPLLLRQRSMQISARVTVTPLNLELSRTLDEFVDMGFHSVGFSPLLAAPNGQGQMQSEHLQTMLHQMIECGQSFECHVRKGHRYPFTNVVNAIRELHHGTHRPYPCGAGAGYMGVSAEGKLYACHRFVEDSAGEMGDIHAGVDPARQAEWLHDRHVHFQEPCNGCWARYLCGGGCHHEVLQQGRPACDYIRGWLEYCLQAYVRLQRDCPGYFGKAP